MAEIPRSEVRIESDGTIVGTQITVDGKPLRSVKSVTWTLDAGVGTATVEIDNVTLGVAGRWAPFGPSMVVPLGRAETSV